MRRNIHVASSPATRDRSIDSKFYRNSRQTLPSPQKRKADRFPSTRRRRYSTRRIRGRTGLDEMEYLFDQGGEAFFGGGRGGFDEVEPLWRGKMDGARVDLVEIRLLGIMERKMYVILGRGSDLNPFVCIKPHVCSSSFLYWNRNYCHFERNLWKKKNLFFSIRRNIYDM